MYKLGRFRQVQLMFAVQALLCASAFFILGTMGLSAMAPGQYGDMAVNFEIEAMAAVQLSAAMLLSIGLLINGRWRWSSALRFAGSLIVATLCLGLGVSSAMAPDGWPFTVYLVIFGGNGLLVAWWNLVDLRSAIFWGGHGRTR